MFSFLAVYLLYLGFGFASARRSFGKRIREYYTLPYTLENALESLKLKIGFYSNHFRNTSIIHKETDKVVITNVELIRSGIEELDRHEKYRKNLVDDINTWLKFGLVTYNFRGSVASVKKILFYANDCEPIKNNFIENQGFMILDCPGFD